MYPGTPYILHERHWENVEVVKRDGDIFRLGPYQFVTVKEGKIAGAYRRDNGEFQLLPHGKSYQLHRKDFDDVEMCDRIDQFKLGPYYFITVQNGYEAVVKRVDTSQFVRLPPGFTYQLNHKDFYEPVSVKRDGHIVRVGPYTFVTVKDGMLVGAYRLKDGAFIEFTEVKEYVLHEKEYHGLVFCDKNVDEKQDFGPHKIITIREGFKGVFEVEGKQEIKDPGFYKVDAKTMIYDSICVKGFQDNLSMENNGDIEFRTKDGIRMQVKCSLTWQVADAEKVAKFGSVETRTSAPFNFVRDLLLERAADQVIRQCKMYNRANLLPTETDLDYLRVGGKTPKEVSDEAELIYVETIKTISNKVVDQLKALSEQAEMGVDFKAVNITLFKLLDVSILENLEKITTSRTKAAAEIAQAEANRDAATSKAEAETVAQEISAERAAKIMEIETRKENNVRAQKAKAQAEEEAIKARADAEQEEIKVNSNKRIVELQVEADTAEKIKRAKAKAEVDQLEADTKNKIEEERQFSKDKIAISRAEAEAKSITSLADADYHKKLKEAEAGSKMPEQEFELKKMELQVQMMSNIAKEVGQAAWKYPDVYTGFIEEFADKLRLGPMAANEILAAHLNKKADIDGDSGVKPPDGSGLFPLAGKLRSGR